MGIYEKIFFFTILNCSEKLVIVMWKMIFPNFLYQQGDLNDRELLFQIISCREKILKILNF